MSVNLLSCDDSRTWPFAAFAVSLFDAGIPCCPVDPVSDPFTPRMLVPCVAALLPRASRRVSVLNTAMIVGTSVPAAVAPRVGADVVNDLTSHNPGQSGLSILAVPGYSVAVFGALAGVRSAPHISSRRAAEDAV